MLFSAATITYYISLFQYVLLFHVEYFINYPLANIWTHCKDRGRYKNKMQNWLSFLLSFHSSMTKLVHLQKVKMFQKSREHQRYLLDCTSKGSCHKTSIESVFPYCKQSRSTIECEIIDFRVHLRSHKEPYNLIFEKVQFFDSKIDFCDLNVIRKSIQI